MTAIYSYAIGSTNPPTNLESLTVPVNPPNARPVEASQFLETADGGMRSQGFPWTRWDFDTLSQAMVNQLRTFCPNQSANVYITTLLLDGTYATYSAVMWWPNQQAEKRTKGSGSARFHQELQITFKRLQVA